MDNLDFAFEFMEKAIGSPLNEIPTMQLSGMQVIEILWALNNVFRPRLLEIRVLPYDNRFEKAADAAVKSFAMAPFDATWVDLAPATLRVLLERHQQAIQLAIGFELQGRHMISIPSSLPESALLPTVMLLWLVGSRLPFPVEDRGSLELAVVPPVPR